MPRFVSTIQRINDMDTHENEQIIAEEAKGGWENTDGGLIGDCDAKYRGTD
jgi:hypothetical protein